MTPEPANTKTTARKRIITAVWRILAATVWTLAFVKVFVFDFDHFLLSKYAPDFLWALQYRLFALIACGGVVAVLCRWRSWKLFVLYVACFPFVFLFWLLPKHLLLYWPLTIAFAPAAYDSIMSFRTNCILYSLAITAAVVIALVSLPIALWIAICVLLSVLVVYLARALYKAYQGNVFSGLTQLTRRVREGIEAGKILGKSTPTNQDGSNAAKKADLLVLYMSRWSFEFAAEKVNEVGTSRKVDLYLLMSWSFTVAYIVVAYSCIYFGLSTIDTEAFSGSEYPTFAECLGYSLSIFTTSSVSKMAAESTVAIMTSYSEVVCMLVSGVIFVFTMLTAARDRYQDDIRQFVKELEVTANAVKLVATQVWELTHEEIEQYLIETDQAKVVNSLRGFRKLPAINVPLRNITSAPQNAAKIAEPESTDRLID